MKIDGTLLGIIIGAISSLMVQYLSNKQGHDDNGSKERIATIEHSGDVYDKLSHAVDEKIALGDKITVINEQLSKVTNERDDWKDKFLEIKKSKDEEIEQLKRQLQVANDNIKELLAKIKPKAGE